MVLVREFSENDLEEVKRVYVRSWSQLCSGLGLPVAEVDFDELSVVADFVAVDEDGRILGFVALKDDLIDRIYVDVDTQGLGIGKALMAEAMRLGGDRLWVDEGSARGRGFYESLGFRPTGVIQRGYVFTHMKLLEYSLNSSEPTAVEPL